MCNLAVGGKNETRMDNKSNEEHLRFWYKKIFRSNLFTKNWLVVHKTNILQGSHLLENQGVWKNGKGKKANSVRKDRIITKSIRKVKGFEWIMSVNLLGRETQIRHHSKGCFCFRGSLLTRNLAELVKKEHFILDSEYLTTLLVVVPK